MNEWKKLRELREAAGLSREALSAKSGVGATQIYRLETGSTDRAKTAFGTVEALADALGVSVEELTSGTDPVTLFVRRINQLPPRDLRILSREAGIPMQDARTKDAYRVFYQSLPADATPEPTDENEQAVMAEEEIWYQAACLIANSIVSGCSVDYEHGPMPLAAALGILADTDMEYLKRRMTNALETQWTDDGSAAQLISILVRLTAQQGYLIDYESLLRDALHWNDPDEVVAHKWLQEFLQKKSVPDSELL